MKKISPRFLLIYLAAFLLALADALTGYVQSSFLNQFFSLSTVGLLLAACALASLIFADSFNRALARWGVYPSGFAALTLTLASSLILSLSQNAAVVIAAFLVRYLGFIFLLIVLDIALEKISTDKITGAIRTKYLLAINTAWLASPLLTGRLVGVNNYFYVYAAGAFLLALLLILFVWNKPLFSARAVAPQKIAWRETLRQIFVDKNLRAIFSAVVALNLFYAIAVLYLPLYLNQTIGLSWQQIGLIFTVMLLPFVLVQFPAGRLADKYLGEKEMLLAGNIIMAAAAICIWLATGRSLIFWATLLFFSRIGAALAESMQEIYFYKKINERAVGLINFFRQARAVGWLAGTLLAFALLKFVTIPQLFIIVAVVLTLNTLQLLGLKDTK